MIRIGGQSMLLNSTGVIAKSQHEEESALLRRKVEELNKNTARLIVEAGKLIQESKQLSAQVKSLESPSTKSRWPQQCTTRPRPEILISALLASFSLLNHAFIFFGNVRLCSV